MRTSIHPLPALQKGGADEWSFMPHCINLLLILGGVLSNQMRILLVEDDQRIANFVAKGLRENAYAVDVARDGAAALYQNAISGYDAIILDVMLPVKDGFEVCRELRENR